MNTDTKEAIQGIFSFIAYLAALVAIMMIISI